MLHENSAGFPLWKTHCEPIIYLETHYQVPIDIIENEVFKIREDLIHNEEPLLEFSLEKLLNFKQIVLNERFLVKLKEFLHFLLRLSFTRNLTEYIANLGNEGVKNLKKILENLVFLKLFEVFLDKFSLDRWKWWGQDEFPQSSGFIEEFPNESIILKFFFL
jgi:hypothetical protein